jgi:hypothetical protein
MFVKIEDRENDRSGSIADIAGNPAPSENDQLRPCSI